MTAIPKSWKGPPCKTCGRPTVTDAFHQASNAVANAVDDDKRIELCWGAHGCIECCAFAAGRAAGRKERAQ